MRLRWACGVAGLKPTTSTVLTGCSCRSGSASAERAGFIAKTLLHRASHDKAKFAQGLARFAGLSWLLLARKGRRSTTIYHRRVCYLSTDVYPGSLLPTSRPSGVLSK